MKNIVALFVLTSTALLCRPTLAQDQKPATQPEAAKAPEAKKDATLDLYVTLMPFIEYARTSGPTRAGFAEGPALAPVPGVALPATGHIGTAVAQYDAVNGPPRMRMTSGTSHVGIRGSLRLAEQLRLLGQFETAMPIDGDPNPWEAFVPNRNSYLGFTGDWGTLAFGLLDTPYRWITMTTINPIKGGYVADYTPIIGTPGFLATAVNPAQRWGGSGESNVAFDRREANSIQYWSPTLFGLYLRGSYTINELRASDSAASVRSNPFIVSIGGGFDGDEVGLAGLRLRYAWEHHHDYYGLAYIYTVLAGAPDENTRTGNDYGNKAVAQYTLTVNPDIKTRVAGIGEYLKYTLHASLPGDVNRYERPAFYALAEQTVFKHHLWGAYGRAYSGKCGRVPLPDGTPVPCTTSHVGAQLIMGGYMFAFSEKAQAYLAAYRLINERSALYVTTPKLSREGLSPGLDTTGVGVGFYYTFGADLLQ